MPIKLRKPAAAFPQIGPTISNASHALNTHGDIGSSTCTPGGVARGSPAETGRLPRMQARNQLQNFKPIVKPSAFVTVQLEHVNYAAAYKKCVSRVRALRKTTLHNLYRHEYNSFRGCKQRAKVAHSKFDARLKDFRDWLVHLGPRPASGWTVDRINTAKGYECGNVRWATKLEQTHNRKVTRCSKAKVARRRPSTG